MAEANEGGTAVMEDPAAIKKRAMDGIETIRKQITYHQERAEEYKATLRDLGLPDEGVTPARASSPDPVRRGPGRPAGSGNKGGAAAGGRRGTRPAGRAARRSNEFNIYDATALIAWAAGKKGITKADAVACMKQAMGYQTNASDDSFAQSVFVAGINKLTNSELLTVEREGQIRRYTWAGKTPPELSKNTDLTDRVKAWLKDHGSSK